MLHKIKRTPFPFISYLFVLFLFLGNKAEAQTYSKCCGTASTQFPFKAVTARKTQLWYNPGDFATLPPSGTITRVYFRSLTGGQNGIYDNFNILFSQPAGNGFTATNFETTGQTNVHTSALITINGAAAANGWYYIDLTTPYLYDNTKALVVEINYSSAAIGGGGGLDNTGTAAVTPPNKKLYAATLTATTGTTSNGFWQDFGFDMVSCTAPTGLQATGITSGSANLSWTVVPGSTGYEYALNTSATPPAGSGTPIPGTSFSQNGLNFATTYYLHVRNICSPTSASAWTTISFVTLANPCTQPSGLNINNITLTSADVRWGKVAGSTGYEYEVNTSATPLSGAGIPIPDTSTSKTGLFANMNYYLHVRNICSPTSQSNWVTRPFTTLACTVPTNIVITTPTASSANFTWNAIPGSLGYEYAVTPGAAPPATGTPTLVNSGGQTGLIPSTTYYIHVRSKCDPTSFSAWTTQMFVMPECNPPVNIITSNITHNQADLIWSVMFGAHHYEWVVDLSREDPGSTTGATTTTAMSAHVTGLAPYTRYYVHIRSVCFVDDKSAWALDSFETSPFCPAPSLAIEDMGGNNMRVTWPDIPTAQSYDFAVNTNKNHPAFGVNITSASMPVSLPPDGQNYYVHVRAKCNGQFSFSEWSTGTLREIKTGVDNADLTKDFISVYPNPVKDRLVIEIGGAIKNGHITIADISGRTMYEAEVKDKKTEADISALPPGIYMLRYADDGMIRHTIKLVKD